MTKPKNKNLSHVGQLVIVRTWGAGVHTGYLLSLNGNTAILGEARRIWRWRGANTLHELALHGAAKEYTRISEPVSDITLTSVTEIIPVSEAAAESLTESRWAK